MENQAPTPLLELITAFLGESGMGESYFGRLAAGNTELVERLRAPGGEDRVSLATDRKVRKFIAERREEIRLARVAAALEESSKGAAA